MTSYSWIKRVLSRAAVMTALASCMGSSLPGETAAPLAQANPSTAIGTWKGESICVGARPACKNEVVVYRLEPIAGKPGVLMWLADKIIDGKRVPMGKLEFQYDEAKGTLSCDFNWGHTHGLWQFKMTADEMEGTLVLLPDKSVGRRVKVKRVKESEVPEAPARELY